MSNLADHSFASINGEDLSLRDAFTSLKLGNQLGVFDSVISETLIRQAAKDEGITASVDQLQAGADAFRLANELFKTDDTNAWLDSNRLTVDDFEKRIEQEVITRQLREKVTKDKIESHFASNKPDFESASISQIVVGTEALANELKAQIDEEDADFAQLAREHSIDESKHQGGSMGRVERKTLSPQVESAVFEAKAGAVAGPVKTDQGFHLIHVAQFFDVELDHTVKGAIEETLFQEWLAERRGKASIKVGLFDEV